MTDLARAKKKQYSCQGTDDSRGHVPGDAVAWVGCLKMSNSELEGFSQVLGSHRLSSTPSVQTDKNVFHFSIKSNFNSLDVNSNLSGSETSALQPTRSQLYQIKTDGIYVQNDAILKLNLKLSLKNLS